MGILSPTGYKQLVLKTNYVNASNYEGQYYWSERTVARVLDNEMYCGHMIQGRKKMISYKIHKQVSVPEEDWIVVRNTHEAIIDEETFKKAQEIIARDTRIKNDGTGEVSMYAGYIRCADCKRAMQRKKNNTKYKTYFYYVCGTYRKKSTGICTKHTLRSDRLDKAVLKAIQMQIDLALEVEQTINEINKSSRKNIRNNQLEQSINAKEKDIEKYQKLKKSAYEDWKLGELTKEEYLEYKQSYEKDILKCNENLEYLKSELNKYAKQSSGENEWLKVFKRKQNITELSREVIIEFIDCIYVHEGGDVTIKFKFEDEYQRILEYIKNNEEIAELRIVS